jgi:anti-anti-sigma regulatory factor
VVRVIDLERDLQITGAVPEFGQDFQRLAFHNQKCSVVLDLQGQVVSDTERFFCVLVRLFTEVNQAQGTLKLCNPSPPLIDAIRLIRLDRMFSIYESLDDALASVVLDPD